MSLSQITQAVLDTARNEADRILKAAQKAAKEKVAADRQAAEAENERRYQLAVRAIDEENQRAFSRTVGNANKELLAEKSRCLRRVFELARQRILALPEDVYVGVMRRLLDQAAKGQHGRLRVHPDEVQRFKTILDEFNAALAGGAAVTLDETAPLPEPGGFVFVSDSYQVDETVRMLLKDLEYELAPHVAAALFGQQGETE